MNDMPKIKIDWFRNALAFFLITAFICMLPLLIYKVVPPNNKEIVVYIIGQLSGMATTCLAFYFTQKAGQDALDAKRADTTAKAFEAVSAAVATNPAVPDVVLKPGETAQAQDVANG